jgi:hypothetical protein
MLDGTSEIRRVNINGDGRAQLDLKADNGTFGLDPVPRVACLGQGSIWADQASGTPRNRSREAAASSVGLIILAAAEAGVTKG